MKTSLALAATTLLGSASAGIHRMKLEKIPFEQQLVCSLPHLPELHTIPIALLRG